MVRQVISHKHKTSGLSFMGTRMFLHLRCFRQRYFLSLNLYGLFLNFNFNNCFLVRTIRRCCRNLNGLALSGFLRGHLALAVDRCPLRV